MPCGRLHLPHWQEQSAISHRVSWRNIFLFSLAVLTCAWCVCNSVGGRLLNCMKPESWIPSTVWHLLKSQGKGGTVALPLFPFSEFFQARRISLLPPQSHSCMLFLYMTQFYGSFTCRCAPFICNIVKYYHTHILCFLYNCLIKWISLKVVMANPLERTVTSAFCFMYTADRSVFVATFSSWMALGQE